MAPRSSKPTTWNEFLPISMPITATALLRFWDIACSFVFGAPCQIRRWRAGARPDHPISGLNDNILREAKGRYTARPLVSVIAVVGQAIFRRRRYQPRRPAPPKT